MSKIKKVKNKASKWCRSEFGSIHFGDKRLDDRFIAVASAMMKQPTRSINHACGSWGETKAAYRLFENELVQPEEILRVHQESTLHRLSGLSKILVVQDTCGINYHRHKKTKGLGGIGTWHKSSCPSCKIARIVSAPDLGWQVWMAS